MNVWEREQVRIMSAKSGASQILKTIASWSDNEIPKGRDRRIRILEKVLKQIREPRYGVTIRSLGLVFHNTRKKRCDAGDYIGDGNELMYSTPTDLACPIDIGLNDDYFFRAMDTARRYLKRLRKMEPEGLTIGIFKYKDPILGITEYRYVNTFWNDSLTEEDRLNQLHHTEKCLAGVEKKRKQLRYIADHPDEVEAEIKRFSAELEAKKESFNQREREAKEREREAKETERRIKLQGQHPVDDGKNSSLDNYVI